jgi:hypothetical protein
MKIHFCVCMDKHISPLNRARQTALLLLLLLLLLPPCCHHCCLCLRGGCSGCSTGVAVCRCRGCEVAATVVDFVFVFVVVFVFDAPRGWICGVPPLPGHGYWCDGLVCCCGHHPWRCCSVSRDKDGANDNNRGNVNKTRHSTPSTLLSNPCPREGKSEGKVDEGRGCIIFLETRLFLCRVLVLFHDFC